MRTPLEAEAHLAKRIRDLSEINFAARMAWEAAELLLLDALKTVREQIVVPAPAPLNMADFAPNNLRRIG